VTGLVGQHAVLGGGAAGALLAAEFLPASALGGGGEAPGGFELVEEELAGEEAIPALVAGGLAFDAEAGGAVK
jgi:hypothetical protein